MVSRMSIIYKNIGCINNTGQIFKILTPSHCIEFGLCGLKQEPTIVISCPLLLRCLAKCDILVQAAPGNGL